MIQHIFTFSQSKIPGITINMCICVLVIHPYVNEDGQHNKRMLLIHCLGQTGMKNIDQSVLNEAKLSIFLKRNVNFLSV